MIYYISIFKRCGNVTYTVVVRKRSLSILHSEVLVLAPPPQGLHFIIVVRVCVLLAVRKKSGITLQVLSRSLGRGAATHWKCSPVHVEAHHAAKRLAPRRDQLAWRLQHNMTIDGRVAGISRDSSPRKPTLYFYGCVCYFYNSLICVQSAQIIAASLSKSRIVLCQSQCIMLMLHSEILHVAFQWLPLLIIHSSMNGRGCQTSSVKTERSPVLTSSRFYDALKRCSGAGGNSHSDLLLSVGRSF